MADQTVIDEKPPKQPGALQRLMDDEVERSRFLKAVGGAGAASLSAFLVAACGSSSKKKKAVATTTTPAQTNETSQFGPGDIGIMNYALTLEYLEAKFYKEVVDANLFSGKT